MIGLFMDRQNERDISLKSCGLLKLGQNHIVISFVYHEALANQEYFYWILDNIHNSSSIEFRVGMGIINNLEVVGHVGNTIKYDTRFSLPTNIEETIYPLYIFQNSDKHETVCYDYIVSSTVGITFLVYEDAFQIRWGNAEVVRYYQLSNFLLMGLTQKDELVSITILQDIRQYIEMGCDEFGDCLDVEIFPCSENQAEDRGVNQRKHQQIITPKFPAHLLEDFLVGLEEITIVNQTGSGLEVFFDIYFRGEKFTLHQDVNLWIVHDFDGNVSPANFEALVNYLAQNNHGTWKHIYLALKKRLFLWG